MQFTPKTEEELNPVFQPGIYEAEVLKAEDTVSKKSGNEMIKLTLKVYGPGEQSVLVTDYLMEAMAKKLRGFCEVAGILDIYESGMLQASDCFGRSVNVKLKIDQQDGFDPKNAVADYLPTGAPITPPPTPKQEPVGAMAIGGNTREASKQREDDDIPF